MKLTRLLSASRYAACRALFAEPLTTLRKLAAFKRDTPPVELKMKDGTVVRLEKPSRSNWLWDHALAPGADAVFEDGLLRFRSGATSFELPIIDDTAAAARWVGRHLPDAEQLRWRNGLLVVQARGQELAFRADSATDWVVLDEVLLNDEYRIAELPDDLGVVIDCGANIGVFSALVSRKARRVILIEPMPQNVEVARRNLEQAGAQSRAEVLQAALGAESNGTLTLWVTEKGPGCNSINRSQAAAFGEPVELKVPTISIADLFERHGIEQCDLFKCDIEGGEYPAFESAPVEVLRRIRRLRMEYHLFNDAEWLARFERLKDKLGESGFRIKLTDPLLPDGKPSGGGYLSATRVEGEDPEVPALQYGSALQAVLSA
ncbi:MAG: FkbM family methyltransferase [Planctomycetota bacterium]|nr:FkbM family methyltransferase [Planctomycetota bacterium]